MKKVIISLVMLTICFSAFSDIPPDVAYSSYTPTFIEWVYVYLASNYSISNDSYSVIIAIETINNNLRIIFNCAYITNATGNTHKLPPPLPGSVISGEQLTNTKIKNK